MIFKDDNYLFALYAESFIRTKKTNESRERTCSRPDVDPCVFVFPNLGSYVLKSQNITSSERRKEKQINKSVCQT